MASDARAFYSAHPGALTSSGAKTLGLAWIIYGVFRLAVTVWLIVFTTTATLMFGALLTRVPDPFTIMTVFHILYSAVIVWSGISAVLGIVAGLTMLASQNAVPGFSSSPQRCSRCRSFPLASCLASTL